MTPMRTGRFIRQLLLGLFVAVGMVMSVGCGDDGEDEANVIACGDDRVEGDEQCDDGNTVGGDGCAANCTEETEVDCALAEGSEATIQWATAALSFPIGGTVPFSVGAPRESAGNGEIPFVVGMTMLDPVAIAGVGCACVRYVPSEAYSGNTGIGVIGCGDGITDTNSLLSVDHNTNDVDPDCETGILVEDGSARHPHTEVCNGRTVTTLSGSGPAGSVVGPVQLQISTILSDDGTCSVDPENPDKGEDGEPCTEDDPPQPLDDPPFLVRMTTGTTGAEVIDANNVPGAEFGPGEQCGTASCDTAVTGARLDCGEVWDAESICTATLAGVFPVLDFLGGDLVVTFAQSYE